MTKTKRGYFAHSGTGLTALDMAAVKIAGGKTYWWNVGTGAGAWTEFSNPVVKAIGFVTKAGGVLVDADYLTRGRALDQVGEATPTRVNTTGPYDNAKTYQFGDVVSYEGGSYKYITVNDASGNLPTDALYWETLANGTIWRSGDGLPSSGLGVPGDYYIDDVSKTYYLKSDAVTWDAVGELVGPQGVAGDPGVDGQTTYTWIRYADNASGSGITNDPSGKAYIGFAYNKTSPVESGTAGDYTWSLVLGPQGNAGVQGQPGANGDPRYTWVKYSANSNGSGLTDTPQSDTRYIGIASNKTTASESNTQGDYTWSQWRGEGALADLDSVGEGQIDADAVNEIEKGSDTSDTYDFDDGANCFLASVQVVKETRGTWVQGKVRIKTTDGSTNLMSLKLLRNGTPSDTAGFAFGVVNVAPGYTTVGILVLDKDFVTSGSHVTYKLYALNTHGSFAFEWSSAVVTAQAIKK
ncbi:MAG: hypothetical protein JKY34_16310 [Kordiimonadaceae bacterium]|nr:hypothetical protein [Kordiimonadaceae bacterium]